MSMKQVLLTTFLLGCATSTFAANEGRKTETVKLSEGKYTLNLLIEEMPESKQNTTLPAEIIFGKDKKIIIHSQGMAGNKIKLEGEQKKNKILFGLTGVEESTLITFHFLGTVKKSDEAAGSLYCFKNGKAIFSGEWSLKKKAE